MCDNFKKTEGISEQSEDANARERIPRGPKNHRWSKNFQSWSTPESKRWLWQRTKMFWQPPELSERFDNFLITIRGIISIWAEAYGREQEWKTCRWISREGRSLPFLVALYVRTLSYIRVLGVIELIEFNHSIELNGSTPDCWFESAFCGNNSLSVIACRLRGERSEEHTSELQSPC